MMRATRPLASVIFGLLCWLPASAAGAEQAEKVTLLRVPGRGIQPQVVVDGKGIVHLVCLRGDPRNIDIFYSRSRDGGKTSSRPLRVNSQLGSAIAIGNIRGAHLAIGKNGRPHVAWNGSDKARPKAPGDATPMLYSRLNDAGSAFEPQRNLISAASVLDGGGSVAADAEGNVCVVWHSPAPGDRGETKRRVWVTRSTDEGKTFGQPEAVNDRTTGVCGCCGLRAFADRKGTVFVLYRAATGGVDRDTYLLRSTKKGDSFLSDKVDSWKAEQCPMSSYTFVEGAKGVVAAWETQGQVYFARIDPATGKRSAAVAAPGKSRSRKHPAVAVNTRGETILVWTEGMGWARGGAVAWQVFDRDGKPTADRGRADGVPAWSLVAVFARPDGGFTVVY